MIVHIISPFWFLELFGSLTSQSLLEYVGISHWLQVADVQNEGFMVSFSLLLRCEHCNYHCHLQLSSTIMDMFDQNFLAIYCHLFMWDVCFFTRNIRITAKLFVECLMRYVRLVWDHGRLRLIDFYVTLGSEKQMAGKGALSSMLFVWVLSSCAICAFSTFSSQSLKIDEMQRISSAD